MLSSQAIEVGDSPMHVAIVPKVEMNASTSSTVQTGLRGAVTMATVQIPQMRVLQAIATKPTQLQTTNFQTQLQVQQQTQPQQIQFLKAVTASGGAELLLPSTTIAGIKTAFTSPGKGGPTVVTIPGARMVTPTNIPAKLKVGDTIVIPTKTLNTMNASCSTPGQPVVIKHESVVFSTPTKVMPNASSKSPMIASPATPIQSGQMKYGVAQQPGTPVSQAHPSPMRLATISPSSWQASPLRYKRPGEFGDHDMYPDSVKKTRRTPSTHDKGSKGLRHFAMLVCEKVKQKGTTTYNEVADELVSEYSTAQRHMNDQYDQKNIRRRVYDALNVLMAMNIIYKDKKDIHWVGLPTNSAQEMQALQTEKQKHEQRIQHKTAQLHELILQQIAFKNLVQRNKRLQQSQGPPASNSAIQLPFIIVNTSKKTVIDCSISNDKYEYLFNFDNTFEIHDDIEVLKRMGMAYGLEKGSCSKEDLRTAQTLVPPVLKPYLEEMAGFKKVFNTFSTSLSGVGKSFNSNMASLNASNNNNSNMLDGGLLLAAMKPDPNDQEVAMVVDQDSLNSESQGSSSSLTMTGPSSSSRGSSADPLSAMHSGATSSSPNLDVPLLSPGNFDT